MGGAAVSAPPVHVAAGILHDAEGRILLGRRLAGRDFAGRWEFPGGKLEAGEGVLAALARELHEELGIRVQAADCTPLISVPFAYPRKRIVLDVHRVGRWIGQPRGREKQALAWVPPMQLGRYPMPAADRPVVAALQQPELYLVTPAPDTEALRDPTAFVARVGRRIAGGIGRVQLRAGCGPPGDAEGYARLATALAGHCRAAGVELLLNSGLPDAAALARGLGTGLHLRAADLAGLRQRPLPATSPVAASCHDAAGLAQAQAIDADFAVLGPLNETASHPGAVPLGWPAFAALRECTTLPLYAIGGLAAADLAQARRHGAQGIAAIRGLWGD